ncbi:MAG: cardiolipin synthase [Acidobacteriota bacterium]
MMPPHAPTWLLVVALTATLLAILLGVLLWSSRTQRRIRMQPGRRPGPVDEILRPVEALTGGWLVDGIGVEIIQNGAFFDRLLRDIAAARHSIHLEVYVWWRGEICERVADALSRRAREGIEVRLLVDAVGTRKMDDALDAQMREAGCRVARYHGFRLRTIGRLNKRDHRKAAIFDGRIAYVFGQGIAQEWVGDARDASEWRDTATRLRGPIVHHMQGAFAKQWMEETEEVIADLDYFPTLEPAGVARAQLVASSPRGGVSQVSLLYRLMIASTSRELWIQNPYFVPDPGLRHLLIDAARRGVDVRVMVPDSENDSWLVRHAARQTFDELLAGGVRLWLYHHTLLHQKIMLIDDVWAHIGSTNFDERSLDINAELSLGILDKSVVATLRAAWDDDLAGAVELDLDTWRRRSLGDRMASRLAYLVNDQL